MPMRVLCILAIYSTSALSFAGLDARDFKTTVGLVLNKKDFKTVCSGVLIREDVVLTAAHCLTDLVSVRVINNYQITRLEYRGVRGKKFWGTSWYQHPDYNGIETGSVDLGVIFLNRKFSSKYRYEKMSRDPYKDIEQSSSLYRVGFGKRPNGNKRNVFEMSFDGYYGDYMTTIDQFGMGGDSGGPVFTFNKNELKVIGVHCGRMLDNQGNLKNISYLQLLTPKIQLWLKSILSDA
jgi:V8-like Glu-specific endopeptidase